MGIQDKAKTAIKNVGGKAQEAFGNAIGNTEAQAEGKQKQAEASGEHTEENEQDKDEKVSD